MLPRRITQHAQEQNWFAVWMDVVIVVVGVFLGIQVANWNDARAEYQRETNALVELVKDLEASIATTRAKAQAYQQVSDAGRRSLAFMSNHDTCVEDCWNRIVDFMHASQWQTLAVSDSTYRNMRNQGLPSNVELINAVEDYFRQAASNVAYQELPVYRSLVRQLISVEVQEFYWTNCWSLVNGIERYVIGCPEGIPEQEAAAIADDILADAAIKRHLTEWIGSIVSLPATLNDQNEAGHEAIELIKRAVQRRSQ